jgi:hypothetical protein
LARATEEGDGGFSILGRFLDVVWSEMGCPSSGTVVDGVGGIARGGSGSIDFGGFEGVIGGPSSFNIDERSIFGVEIGRRG